MIGEPATLQCPLCHQHLPSHHSLAAHLHRKHAVVNVLTRYTAGTVCLWCHTEHHSTDRLKYHLSRNASCMHGLRVVVGQVYSYGTGTKRTGARLHRGLPPIRISGPINATAAQRLAAIEGRQCTPVELQQELLRVTGATDVYSWPPLSSITASNDHASPAAAVLHPESSLIPSPCEPASLVAHSVGRWYSLVDQSIVTASDWHTPSPLWERLLAQPFVVQWPPSWHRYWRIWHAMHTLRPWSPGAFRAARVLREANSAFGDVGMSFPGPPSGLLDFLAATVAFRQICDALTSRGCAWICGVPSSTGRSLLRLLLPAASFHVVPFDSSAAFVVSHVTSPPPVWHSGLSSLSNGCHVVSSPRVVPLRSSLIYRTRS